LFLYVKYSDYKDKLRKSEPVFIKAFIRPDKDYLFELTKIAAVDEGDINWDETLSAFFSKYGKPDYIHLHNQEGRLSRRTFFYTIRYEKKPCIFMVIFNRQVESWELIYNLIDMSFGQLNKAGDKMKKAF